MPWTWNGQTRSQSLWSGKGPNSRDGNSEEKWRWIGNTLRNTPSIITRLSLTWLPRGKIFKVESRLMWPRLPRNKWAYVSKLRRIISNRVMIGQLRDGIVPRLWAARRLANTVHYRLHAKTRVSPQWIGENYTWSESIRVSLAITCRGWFRWKITDIVFVWRMKCTLTLFVCLWARVRARQMYGDRIEHTQPSHKIRGVSHAVDME